MIRSAILFNIITFALGVIASYSIALLANRYKQKILKYIAISLTVTLSTIIVSTFFLVEQNYLFKTATFDEILYLYCATHTFTTLFNTCLHLIVIATFLNSRFWSSKKLTVLSFALFSFLIPLSVYVSITSTPWIAAKKFMIGSSLLSFSVYLLIIFISIYNMKEEKFFRKKVIILIIVLCVLAIITGVIDYSVTVRWSKIYRRDYFPPVFMFSMIYYFFLFVTTITVALPYLIRPDIYHRNLNYGQIIKRYSITRREREILDCIVNGYSNLQIGAELNISISTVKTHVYNLFQKTSSENRIELINVFK
ncbi:MAG: helix-turn-helix transcriptional regulator [Spirochaetes bacterium]|jgi:DNA-binding CsgD family transcriptional regulator|nr:helix-turn-helix transcriptional regulator [Spirochaetota bacterium]